MAMSDAARKRKSRAAQKAHLDAVFGRLLSMDMYKGTCADVDFLKSAGGFEQDEEVITLLVRNAAIMLKRDMSRFEELLGLPTSNNL